MKTVLIIGFVTAFSSTNCKQSDYNDLTSLKSNNYNTVIQEFDMKEKIFQEIGILHLLKFPHN